MAAKFLVPLDGSETGDRILSFVDRLPGRQDLALMLLRAVPAAEDESAGAALAHLRTRRDDLRKAGIAATACLVPDEPARAVIESAALLGATLVAMATHGEGGVRDTVRGSVAEEVLRTCPVPLLLGNVHSLPVDPGSGFARILVPLDGTATSAAVLPLVESIARQSDSEVVLFHAQPDGEGGADEGAQVLAPWAARLRTNGLTRVQVLTATGDPAAEILQAVDTQPADLLALTSHSRNSPSSPRRWFGSVAETVLSRAGCPLLVHRVV